MLYTICPAYRHVFIDFLLNTQEAEAKAAAAEEREQFVNERLSQTLSRINVLEAQVLISNDFHHPPCLSNITFHQNCIAGLMP